MLPESRDYSPVGHLNQGNLFHLGFSEKEIFTGTITKMSSLQDGMEVDGSEEEFGDAPDTFNDDDDLFDVGGVRRPEPLSKYFVHL